MRGLLKAGVLLGPALAGAVSLEEGGEPSSNWNPEGGEIVDTRKDTIPSAFITLHLPDTDETTATRDVVLRFDIHESTKACGYGDVTLDGQPISEEGSGSFTVDEGRVIDATWNLTCVAWNDVPQEQLLSLNVGSIDGQPVEDVGFTVRFQQIAPVWISDVEGSASMTRIHSISEPKPPCDDEKEVDVDAELAELDYLRWQVSELHQQIFTKERRLAEALGWPRHDRPPMIEDCDSLRCVAKALLHKVKGAAWPFYGGMEFGPGHHGRHHGGPWANHHGPPGHHEHPHGGARGHGHSPFGHEQPRIPHGHHGNHTSNGTHPHPPPFGHPPPFCKCPPPGPHGPPHGEPHGPPGAFPHMPPPPGRQPGSPHPPPPGSHAHGPHGSSSEHVKPEGHKTKWGEQVEKPSEEHNEDNRPEPHTSEPKEQEIDEPEMFEAELRRDFEHHDGPRHDGPHHGPHPEAEGKHHDGPHHGPHDFEGHSHDGPHNPHLHDGPEDFPPPPFEHEGHDGPPPFDFDPMMGPPPPPTDHEGNPMPPPPGPGPHGGPHGGPPHGMLFIHIASVAASVILLGVFIRVLHQRCSRRSPALSHRRRRSYSNAPWYKKLCFGPNYQQIEEEEKEAMLGDCDSDCSSVEGDEDLVVRDISTFRTAADVVGEMVAVEEGRMMMPHPHLQPQSHSRQSSHGSMMMQHHHYQQQQQQVYAPVPMPMHMSNTVPIPISAEAAAMFPDLHHDDIVDEALPAYQEASSSDDDDASEVASSLMADGYRPGCSGSYTPSESGSQGASDILGDTKN